MSASDLQRIWVSEDRCVLLSVWFDDMDAYYTCYPSSVTVATREHPSHTWGPPVTLTEEET
jgi:hypothetical protein